jgi:hypothetical protein
MSIERSKYVTIYNICLVAMLQGFSFYRQIKVYFLLYDAEVEKGYSEYFGVK